MSENVDEEDITKITSTAVESDEIDSVTETTSKLSSEVDADREFNLNEIAIETRTSGNATDDGHNDEQNITMKAAEKVNSTNADTLPQTVEAEQSTTTKLNEGEENEEVTEEVQLEKNTKADNEVNQRKKETSVPSSEKDTVESDKVDVKPSASANDEYAAHVTYTEDGSAIYTDPKTNYKYKWSAEQNSWVPTDATASSSAASANNPYENEHYKWCSETQQWLPKEQQQESTATETAHYKWDATKKEWIPKTAQPPAKNGKDEVTYDLDEDGQRIYTDKDGAVFFWDETKNAWFPKIDDDFMARYQMNYGFIDNTSAGVEEKRLRAVEEERRKAEELARMAEEAHAAHAAHEATSAAAKTGTKRKTQEPPKWFDLDPEHNTKVYVSNLPQDITLDEFTEVMSKCGMIMRDPQTQKFKLKLYTEANGQVKGDGLCDYIKVESVDLALNILDGYDLRGNKIRVQPAKFQMRGEYNPSLKPKRKKKDKEKMQKMKEKLFDWRPEKMRGERSKNEKVVIIKNLFHPELFEKEVQLILDYQNDLREECSKCGTVRKVVIYDRHIDGVAQVNMASPEEADLVIQMMQGRFFGKRQLTAEHWDGKTKYKIVESETEVQQRLNKWDKFLETDEEKKGVKEQDEKTEIAVENAVNEGQAEGTNTQQVEQTESVTANVLSEEKNEDIGNIIEDEVGEN